MSEKTDIKSMDLEELKTFFSDMGEKAFRAKQVYEWLHVRQVESFEEMTNLSKTLRERLDETCRIITLWFFRTRHLPESEAVRRLPSQPAAVVRSVHLISSYRFSVSFHNSLFVCLIIS